MSLTDVWQKLFSNFQWQNKPSTATPLGKTNLQKLNDAIDGIDDRVLELKTGLDGVTEDLEDKVDKVEGKGLSTEDFTTAEKTKLAGISAEANKVEITPVVTEGTTLATISIDGVDTDIKGSDIDVDSTLSPTSENPVQNKVIYAELQNILPEKTETGNPISISDAAGLNAKECSVEFAPIQDLRGQDAPYSNICPISGRDSLVLGISGKNLFDKNAKDTNKGYAEGKYLFSNGDYYTPTTPGVVWNVSEFIRVVPNMTYTISGLPTSSSNSPCACLYSDADISTFIESYQYFNNASVTFTTPSNCNYVRLSLGSSQAYIDDIQLEIGSTATAYESFVSLTTHTATFPDTVYGGIWKATEGKAVITHKFEEYDGTENWALATGTNPYFRLYKPDGSIVANTIISSQYPSAEVTPADTNLGVGNTAGSVRFRLSPMPTLDEFKTMLTNNPVQVCYELETPTEITLTPETIALLKGNNTLWTDGDNVKLVYSADIKAYIDSQLNS